MTDFTFHLASTTLEGGSAFAKRLATALTDLGHAITFGSQGEPTVIDGAALRDLPVDDVAGRIGLIHHTTALVTDADREAVRAAERERLPLLRRVIATSALVGERLVAEFGVDPGRLTIIPPGVPDAPRATGSGGPNVHVLSIGALVPRKGHAVLIRALQRLTDLPWWLTIVGADRGQGDDLRALAGPQVTFAGALDDAALEQAWRTADMFALATEWEGYAAPVAEALRRGLPVAVTKGGAAASLVTPEAGVMCEPGDMDGLSKALRRLIFDAPLRADMAKAAWQVGQTLPTWRTQAEKFVQACC